MSDAIALAPPPPDLASDLELDPPRAAPERPTEASTASAAIQVVERLKKLANIELEPPKPARLGLGAVGFLAAFAATLPSIPLDAAASVGATGLVSAVSATVLTGPAVVVLHQYLRLRARPADVLAAIGQGFADAGNVALGLSPLILFLAVTSPLALPALLALLGASILVVLVQTLRRLVHLEIQAPGATLPRVLGMAGVSLAWLCLTALIGGRIALSFLFPAFG